MVIDFERFENAWREKQLEQWFTCQFPELGEKQLGQSIPACLKDRVSKARHLGFTRVDHWKCIIGYEFECGLNVFDPVDTEYSHIVGDVLRQRDVPPEQRINEVEQLIYGVSNDGSRD